MMEANSFGLCTVTSDRLAFVSDFKSRPPCGSKNEGFFQAAAVDLRVVGGIRCRRVIHLRLCLGFGAEQAVAMQE
jgi:hypothetical protein